MSVGAKESFTPIPTRAMTDRRLAERHWRTLAVVAAHDRLGKNGVGCWASHRRLATLVGCDYARLSSNLTDLASWGYIERSVHPLNKRLRVYKVLYTPEDAAVMKGIGSGNSSPDGKQSSSDSLRNGKVSSHQKGEDDRNARNDRYVTGHRNGDDRYVTGHRNGDDRDGCDSLPTGDDLSPDFCQLARASLTASTTYTRKYIPLKGIRYSAEAGKEIQ